MANQNKNIRSKASELITFHTNLDQHAWIILEDKVRLTLIEYEKQFQKDVNWWNPLSLLVTVIISIITTKFEDFYFIPADTICAMFYMAAIIFAYQTCKKIRNAIKNRAITIDDVIQMLRESSDLNKSGGG